MKKKHAIWIISIFLIYAADFGVKRIMSALSASVPQPIAHRFFVIPDFLVITYHENSGGAFGLFQGWRWVFVAVTVVALIISFYFAFSGRIKHITGEIAFIFLIGGALGNFFDRVFHGYVIDMFQFIFADHFLINYIFNVADVFVTAGGVLFCVYLLFYHERRASPPSGAEGSSSSFSEEVSSDEANQA